MSPTRVIRRVLAAGAAGVLAWAAPAAAGPVFHTSFHGSIAIAAWTSCPEPKAGDECFDTEVIASDATTYENSDQPTGGHFLHDRGDRVTLRHFWYSAREIDGQLVLVTTKESFGGTDEGVTVDIDHRLRTASANAPLVPMHTTDFANDREYDETGSVSVSWLQAGSLYRLDDRSVFLPGYALFLDSTLGFQVDATATGVDDGVPITRAPIPGATTVFTARQLNLEVYRGPTPSAP